MKNTTIVKTVRIKGVDVPVFAPQKRSTVESVLESIVSAKYIPAIALLATTGLVAIFMNIG